MINIIITAGGTIEDIDKVRKITNTSTGRLGSLICKEFIKVLSESGNQFKIYYIYTKTAVKPAIDCNIEFYEVDSTLSVKETIEDILENHDIHYFIHSMAVSDFTADYVVSTQELANEIATKIKDDMCMDLNKRILEVLNNPSSKFNRSKKVSSKANVMIGLKQTPKIIGLIKEKSPNTFLVGFKLLNNVSEEYLIEIANNLMKKNKCNMVLANDYQYIQKGEHYGLLIKDNKEIIKCFGKEQIAKALVEEMLKEGSNIA